MERGKKQSDFTEPQIRRSLSEEERRRRRRALRRKREQQRRRRLAALTAVCILLLCAGIFFIAKLFLQRQNQEPEPSPLTASEYIQQLQTEYQTEAALQTESEIPDVMTEAQTESTPALSSIAQLETLNSPYAVLMDASTGEILAEHNSESIMYPASMTKILTAVTAMETLSLDQTITMPYEIYDALYQEGASMAGFEAGETVTVRDLLYGVILPSGAECCLALANTIDGSEAAFAQRMNQKALEIGMTNTHFVTSTGLHNEQHYSTVKDIAVLLHHALQNGDFRAIFTTHRYSVAPTNQHPEGFTFYSTMFLKLSDSSVTGGEILGGKTGYTENAGLCLASLAKIGDREYILVTGGAPGSPDTDPLHTIDAAAVYSRIGSAL